MTDQTPTNDLAIAVVIPRYREETHPEEELSLRHVDEFLVDYDRIFLSPKRLRPRRDGYGTVHFDDDYFRSVDDYSRLLLSPSFYQAFDAYDFILLYQLDALVFSDRLVEWCRAGYDYVGAPWLVDPDRPERGFSRVGNGGFSLRRVDACLRVLESTGAPSWSSLLRAPLPDLHGLAPLQRWAKRLRVVREARRGVRWYARHYSLNEDHFWSDRARLFDPRFRVAPIEAGLRFAFERAPRYCLAGARGELPFGCHAWQRWDREFWAPYLLR